AAACRSRSRQDGARRGVVRAAARKHRARRMEIWAWVGFNAFVLALLALDLGVFHREAHEVRVKEAAVWSIFWVLLSLAFGAGVYYFRGSEAGLEFLTGYLIEKALSVDNIFVF